MERTLLLTLMACVFRKWFTLGKVYVENLKKVIFQGDSITECNRDRRKRRHDYLFGAGYTFIIAAQVGRKFSDSSPIFSNHAISGSLYELSKRWNWDCLHLQPSLVSLLIGIDEVLTDHSAQSYKNYTAYRNMYEKLISESINSKNHTRMVLGEPFALDSPTPDFDVRLQTVQTIIREVGLKYKIPVIQYQTLFNNASKKKSEGLLSHSVYPLHTGCRLMADLWIKTVLGEEAVEPERISSHIPLMGLLKDSQQIRLLFQGDSITDCNRDRGGSFRFSLGLGYAYLIAADISRYFSQGRIAFSNDGISGSKVIDLEMRWQRTVIEARPTVLSILIGVNDVWDAIKRKIACNYTDVEYVYSRILKNTIEQLPDVKIVLGEPFLGRNLHRRYRPEEFNSSLINIQNVVHRLGIKFSAPVVKYQAIFDASTTSTSPARVWFDDGIHPTAAGHQLMAEEWIRVVLATWG